jgi:hypothetical protein
MASGAAAPVKMSTAVTACILLAVLLPMAPKLVMGDVCSDRCGTLCDTFADGFCTGNANDPGLCPTALEEPCKPTLVTGCTAECNSFCTTGGFVPCAA